MEIKYNITGKERKEFVKAISGITKIQSKYLGMPTCAYAIGDWYSRREGAIPPHGLIVSHRLALVKNYGYYFKTQLNYCQLGTGQCNPCIAY